jgi:hypothetical protein
MFLPSLTIQDHHFRDPAFKYKSFNKTQYTLFPWPGRNVAVLTKSKQLSHAVMARLIAGIDKVYDYYNNMTGVKPTDYLTYTYKGRLSIAEVLTTCGTGCGYTGITGVELLSDTFNRLYDQIRRNNALDQVVFYELGRNFWFYEAQLGKVGADHPKPGEGRPFGTGFAILNRFLSMEAAGRRGAPFMSSHQTELPFEEFKRSILKDLLETYLADNRLSWQNTLALNMAPSNPNCWGAADLAAAMLNVINVDAGPNGLRTFWRTLGTLPAASTDVEAMENFLRAGKAATGHDYRDLSRDNSLPMP